LSQRRSSASQRNSSSPTNQGASLSPRLSQNRSTSYNPYSGTGGTPAHQYPVSPGSYQQRMTSPSARQQIYDRPSSPTAVDI
jgi:hypothetical protein